MSQELTPAQAAALLGTSTRSVQRWIASGRLPARRVGGRWRVAADALDALTAPTSRLGTGSAIETLFVANRGEIARRIARTCRELGIRAVIPATDGPEAVDLLDPDAVLAAAIETDADALHPGYGFLAESAAFAALVESAGIRWVGPPRAAIEAMGDKAAARRLAAMVGVPVLPGYDGADQSDEALDRAAAAIGFPLLVKPSAGGGGKGMRVVREASGLAGALGAARREARVAFGDDRLILERYLEGPRHVEIQVLFDAHGSGVHLGERDCSIQRRHQKVLEESPSPAVDDALRERMGRAALALARQVGYVSAGTCEFLLDDREGFYFLEMNTRLQVEHPVTEAVTGRDLVADQLRVAADERLGIGQADVRPAGHAVEVRLYAEDAEAGFLPATGRVVALQWPSGDGIRVDAGIDAGSEIGGRYDPMLAKIVACAPTRGAALERLARALDETVVLGVVTNLRFLRWLVREPAVVDGQARVDTLERIWPPDDWADRATVPATAWSVAASTLGGGLADGGWSGAWRLNAQPVLHVACGEEVRAVEIARPGGQAPGLAVAVANGVAHVDVDGRSVAFRIAPPPDVDAAARAAAAHAQGGGPSELVAPMPGLVARVHVGPGELVDSGDAIVTLEAMKMEHVVLAPVAGRLAELLVEPGDQVTRGQPLGTVEPLATDEPVGSPER